MSGANPAAVQRIMRHADPKLTLDVYSHLAPDYLRTEVDRLAFGVRPPEIPLNVDVCERETHAEWCAGGATHP